MSCLTINDSHISVVLCLVMLGSGLRMWTQLGVRVCVCVGVCVCVCVFLEATWPNALKAAAVTLRKWRWRRGALRAIRSQSQAGRAHYIHASSRRQEAAHMHCKQRGPSPDFDKQCVLVKLTEWYLISSKSSSKCTCVRNVAQHQSSVI